MKGIIILANYFEDVEALITIDILRRAKIDIDLISIEDKLELTTQSNIKITADKFINEVNLSDYNFLVLPGGKAVFNTHIESNITKKTIEHFYNNNLLIAAICAAPIVLGKYGCLDGRNFVCFPSCEEEIHSGILNKDKRVVVDGNIITSKAAGTTFDFAYEIVKYLKGKEEAEKVIGSVYY